MIQTLTAYAIFVAAAGWVIWRMLMPAALRTRLKARLGGKDCGDDCGCGR